MSIGSIDVATLAPRTMNAAETQGKENTQNQHIGEQNAVQFQRETVQQAQQTVKTQESEMNDYDKGNGAGKGRSREQTKKKRQGDNAKSQQKMAPRSNSSFDIMI